MSAFPHLLSPGRIGTLALRNRIAMAPMGTNLGEADGTVGDAMAVWYAARAEGGAGLLIAGSVSVAYPHGSTDARMLAASDEAQLPGLRRLADDAHQHGAVIAAQLVHTGTNSLLDIAEGRPLLVPSKKRSGGPDALSAMVTAEESAAMLAPFASPTAAFQVQEATDDDLAWVIARFVDAADRCRRAGFDAIELHAGHGYLLHSFLSPASNTRDDRWGGSVDRRAELFVEVVRAVRASLGPGFPLWARVGVFEAHRDPGQRIEDALVAMGLGIDAGLDAIHVTAYGEPMVATGITDGHTPHRARALLEHAATVRRELGVPVLAMGRISPEAAEQALADGAADVIAMGRALIADPELPNKLAAGRRDRIRPCAYQYRCIGSIFLNQSVTCSVNPEAGHESETVGPPSAPRHVVVAGGGPAGLECARRLAERGHQVELWERSERLGGMLTLAEQVDPDLAGLRDWLIGAAVDAGVEIHLGRAADAGVTADVLVWATGAAWSPDVTAVDRDGRVAVHGSSKAAVSIATHLGRTGATVTLIPDDPVLAPELGLPGRFRLVADLPAAGVTIATESDAETVLHIGRTGGAAPPEIDGVEVHVVGDAFGTAGLAAALSAAAAVANQI